MPLLGTFALLIIVAVVAIGFVIAAPSTPTLVIAVGTVMAFAAAAAAVSYLLARMIGD